MIKEGLNELIPIFDKFENGVYKNYKFLDILNCNGRCINEPGFTTKDSISKRRKKVLKYRDYASRFEKDLGRTGLKTDVEEIDFRRSFS